MFGQVCDAHREDIMNFIEILILAVALSMDAFAVALCKGLATPTVKPKHMLLCGVWFGVFQALMPLIGFFLGVFFRDYIIAVDHWIAFVLLAIIGFNMVKEAFECDCEKTNASFALSVMLTMAVATSIDALAAGISLAMDDANIWISVLLIGAITFTLSAIGVKVGNVFGSRYRKPAELIGGITLILMGFKIVLEHLGIIAL